MQDNKFLDKDFVKSEYNKLLDHYFSSSAYARNKNNLLYEYTKSNESINEAKKSLRESSLNYGFGECIDYAAQKFNNVKDKEKKEKYLDIIRVLAVNGAHSESLINIFDSKELKKIASQSIFTTARSAYQAKMQTNDKKGIELLDENGKAKHLSSTERKAVIDVAIDECDPKLVQLLLGAKYCMLWQYWLIRAIFNFDMLFLSKMTKCELPLDIANKQLEYLSGGIQLESTARKSLVESTVAQQLAGTSLQCYRDNNEGCDVSDSIEAAVNADFSQECKSMMKETINEFKQITQSTDDVCDLQNALRDKVVKLESMEKSLSLKIDKVNEGIIKKMQDNKFLDKDFVKSECNKLIDYYFRSSAYARNKNNLLYKYTKSNKSINEAKKSLRESSLNYGCGECIDYAAQKFKNVKDKEKKEKYLDIIRVLAVNGVHSESLINIFDSEELKKIASQSIFTTARRAYQVLFDFDNRSDEFKFMSNIVGEDGKFADPRSQNVRILESSGSPIVKTILGNLKKVEKELQEKRESGKANRRVGIFSDIGYYLLDFLNEKVLANKLDPQSKEQHIKTYTVLYETLEISYLAMATGDDRVIVDYGKELKSKIKNESNKDIVEVYSVLYSLFEEYRAVKGKEDPTSDIARWQRFWYHFQDIFRPYNDNVREDKAIKALRIAMYATEIVSEEYEEQQRQRFTKEFRNIDVKFLPSNCLINWLGATYEGIQKSEQEQTAQKDKKIAQESHRAEQESQRAELTEKISQIFTEVMLDSNMERELRKTVSKSQVSIVRTVVKDVMEHNSSPEQILNEMMGEIKRNKEKILSTEDATAAIVEAIESAIMSLNSQGTSVSNVNISQELLEKHKNNIALEKESLELLAALGEIKAYWWWPWSAKVKEIVLSESQKERAEKYPSYFFLHRVVLVMFTSVLTHRIVFFQQSGGYMNRNQQFNNSEESSAVQIGQQLPEASGSLTAQDQLSIQHLNFLGSAMVYNVELEWALHLMGFSSQTLSNLDESLAQVRSAGYSKEAMAQYALSFKEIFSKKYKELACKVHPDKQNTQNSSDIKDEKMKDLVSMNEVMNGLYEASKEIKNSFRYGMFAKIAFNFLHKNIDKCTSYINKDVVAELRNITIWRQSDLLYCRNEFLKNAQELFAEHKTNLPKMKQNFEKLIDNYTDRYKKLWLDNLRDLKHRCDKDKNLNIIEDEVQELLKEGSRQLLLLIKPSKGADDAMLLINKFKFKKEEKQALIAELEKSDQVIPDKCFILPMMVYKDVMKQLFKSYYAGNMPLHDIAHFTDVFKENAVTSESQEFHVKQYIEACSFSELQKWINLLKEEDILHKFTKNHHPLREFIDSVEYQTKSKCKWPRKATREEMKRVILIQILDRYIVCLKEEFTKEKTWFKRMEEEIQQIQEGIQEKDKKIAQESHRAEQESQRAELTEKISQIFTEVMLDSDMERELRKTASKSQVSIVRAVVKDVMERNSSPELLLNEVMGEIGRNKAQILNAENATEAINAAIESAIMSFNSQGTSMNNVNISQAGTGLSL
ncbi:DnaJ domain [Cinara cedri]|uniref:DnaJ domain n=1 Tax=Cinara cedri TaxID=506608 RepID=A0A5E4NSY1_9HEMI|nr:DnaJ domain [Cinara cedri]